MKSQKPGQAIDQLKKTNKQEQLTSQQAKINVLKGDGRSGNFISGLEVINAEVPENSFLIDDIIPLNTICMLCGPSDTGKSILARQIAVSAALGKTSVGGLPLNLTYKKAIYLSTEDAIQDWKAKLKKYSLSAEDELRLENLSIIFDYDTFKVEDLENRLKVEPVDVIIIDVFTDLFEKDLNNAIQVRNFFSDYKHLATKYGCTIIFIHHLSKKGEASSPSKANVLGSQGIESSMRCVLELRADPKEPEFRHLIITKSNYLPASEKQDSYKLFLDSSLQFKYDGVRASIGNLSQVRTVLSPVSLKRIMQLNSEGHSIRKITDMLNEEGIALSKSRVGEIIRQEKLKGKTGDIN